MPALVDAATTKSWLSDTSEIAFIDVREAGQYGEGHPFFAISAPYSQLELQLPRLVPNVMARLVLIDGGDGVAARAARRAETLGYQRVHVLAGGVEAWQRAGYTLFAGVNVPSKTFGELVELQRHTPRITADELQRMQAAGERLVIVDGRPLSEFQRMCIPGGICCPNGELALRIRDIVPDPETKVVVNCAGRTRSIIGAQTLIDIGLPNAVYALENGTQGWFLAGLDLERGAARRHGMARPDSAWLGPAVQRARALAGQRGVRFVAAETVKTWLGERGRTTFLLDIRSPDEHQDNPVPNAGAAPGGQLIQATDQWVGVKGARLVLLDDDGLRAPMVAQWLRQLGHAADVLDGGVEAAMALPSPATAPGARVAGVPEMTARELATATGAGFSVIDVRSSTEYRAGHLARAVWSIRTRIEAAAPVDRARAVVLADGGQGTAELAAMDLRDAGYSNIRSLEGGSAAWAAAGLPIIATPHDPPDSACIDFLFFVHDRHSGNAEAARRYLAWEMGLLAQLDDQERGMFRVAQN